MGCVRSEVIHFLALGPLPDEAAAAKTIAVHQGALEAIPEPVTDAEAVALVTCFGRDECFGLAWTLLHKIESAPGWPLHSVINDGHGEWVELLRDRAARSGLKRLSLKPNCHR
jgi:hypothetical protein